MAERGRTSASEAAEHYGFGVRAMRKVKVCPSCGAAAGATEQFCGQCGAKLPEETLFQSYRKQSRRCAACDTILPARAQFCPRCGTRLNKQEGT